MVPRVRAAWMLTLLATGQVAAAAQPVPDAMSRARPIRMIAASAAGGGIDIVGRIVGQRLTEATQQQVVVDNRAGSGGLIATELVVRAAPDGLTLLVQSVGVAYVGTLHKNATFDVTRDLAPVALVASQPSLVAVHAALPVGSIDELVRYAKARPGQVSFGTGGAGGASHMGTELFAQAAGIRLLHVPYKGTGPSMAALLSGEVNLALVGVATALPHLKSGRIKPLWVTSAKRSSIAPDIPTVAEAGVAGYEFAGWYGLLAPARTPRAVIDRINRDVNQVLAHPDMQQQFALIGFEPLGGSVDAFRAYFLAEVSKWKKVIAEAGIVAQ